MIFLFLNTIKSECDMIINTKIGVKKYEINLKNDGYICFNTTYYPLYISFNNYEKDVLFYQYNSLYNYKTMNETFHTYLRFLPFYISLNSPFSSASVFLPALTNITFTISTLPGMCNNGIFFTNLLNEELSFSKFKTGFFKLDIYDDKCIIFTSQGHQNLEINMESDDLEDQIFIYRSFNNFTSISGNNSIKIFSKKENPLFLRIIADDISPPDYINISFQSDGEPARKPGNSFFIPQFDPPICDDEITWYTEKLTISLIILMSLLLILTGLLISTQCVCKKNDILLMNSAADSIYMSTYTNNIQSTYSILGVDATALIE